MSAIGTKRTATVLVLLCVLGLLSIVTVSADESKRYDDYKVVYMEEGPLSEEKTSIDVYVSTKRDLKRQDELQKMICKVLTEVDVKAFSSELSRDRITDYDAFIITLYFDFDDFVAPHSGDRLYDPHLAKAMERFRGAYNYRYRRLGGTLFVPVGSGSARREIELDHGAFCRN